MFAAEEGEDVRIENVSNTSSVLEAKGYTSDGVSNMTDSVQGLGTRIGNVACKGFNCV